MRSGVPAAHGSLLANATRSAMLQGEDKPSPCNSRLLTALAHALDKSALYGKGISPAGMQSSLAAPIGKRFHFLLMGRNSGQHQHSPWSDR